MIQLRPYQNDFVAAIRDAYRRHRRVLAVAPTGAGKCLGRGTPVLLFDGRIKAVETVRVGDVLMGPDSQPRTVVSVTSGMEEMFRVTQMKGDSYEVNRSHILSLKMTGGSLKSCGIPDGTVVNITVDEYLQRNKTFKHCAKGWRTAVDFAPHTEPMRLDPYFFGVWLGDGNSNKPSITTGDIEIATAVRVYASSIGLKVREEPNSPGSVILHVTTEEASPGRGHRTNPIKLALHQYGVINNKHIPNRYLTASRADRLELMAGIIDTDGHLSKNGGFEIVLKSERLFDNVLFLCRSLGFSCSKRAKVVNGTTYWRSHINGPVNQVPCRLPRKISQARRQIKDVTLSGISVESIGVGEYFGFEIAGPDRLFLLGDFTVTHNTICFVYITTSSVAKGKRITIVAHRQEIVDQISAALDAFGVRHGRIQAGHTPTDDPVQVAMVITLGLRIGKVTPADFLVIDEAHHVNAGSYAKIIEAWPETRILGVTATPTRLDGKPLGKHFDTMVLGPSVKSLIDAGFLASFQYLAPPQKADLSDVKTVSGDYDIQSLSDAMNRSVITGDAVEHARTYLTGKPAIAFCVTVQHAEDVAQQFRDAGFRAASVDGSMGTLERRDLIRSIGDGRLDVLTSCAIISEGTDIPVVGGAILLRPTQSLSVHLQQVGRALRPKPDGSKAVILDHVGNVTRHGLPDMEREWSLSVKAKRANPGVTTCDICYKAFQPHPGWIAEAECGSDDFHPPGCLLDKAKEVTPKALPAFDPAQLVEYTTKPVWADGLDIASARGPDWFDLLRRAETPAQLAEIARIRKYKRGWVKHVLAERASHRQAAE